MHHYFSQEIQGLRALAVIGVVVFHIWPSLMPGGYVGVDVFFVISGYLITRILFIEGGSSKTIDLKNFYTRRINRLMPAAAWVIFICLCFSWLLPSLEWVSTAKQAVASIFYVQNWLLAEQSVDYLGGEEAPGLFQHFWSLSVEEQFYIFWPIIILGCFEFYAKKGRRAVVFTKKIVWCMCLGGLTYSVIVTLANPAWAYFSTTTRLWEILIGGCVATTIGVKPSATVGLLASVLGVGAILTAYFTFSTDTLFPGYMALLPTVGTALVIYSTQVGKLFLSTSFLRMGLMQYLGGISYSLYLWHWPLVTFFKNIFATKIGWTGGVLVILASIFMAHGSKILIEDRFRNQGRRTAIRVLLVCMVVPIISVAIIKLNTGSNRPEYIGPGDGADTLSNTAPLQARKDLPEPYKLGCHTSQKSPEVIPCVFGPSSRNISIAVVGDSHAAHWVPALKAISAQRDIKLISYTKSGCNFSNNSIYNHGVLNASCDQWRETMLEILVKTEPTLILLTQSRTHKVFDEPDKLIGLNLLAQGVFDISKTLSNQNLKHVLLADTPRLEIDIPVCLSSSPSKYSDCDSPQYDMADPILMAALKYNLRAIDMNKYICPSGSCNAVQEGRIVWRDTHHLTASFSRTLAQKLWAEILIHEPSLSSN